VTARADRVVGVGVLRAAVQQRQLGFAVAPTQSAELAKSVDGDEEASHVRHSRLNIPFAHVLVKVSELVVGEICHKWNRRRK